MKKLLVGCLVVLALGVVLFAAGAYVLYRAASPLIEDAREYLEGFSELRTLEDRIVNKTPHSPPDSGELTESQVQRFVRVQEHVRKAMGQRLDEIESKYESLKSDTNETNPSFGEVLGALRDMSSLVVDARRYQVDALNQEKFSQEEYSWVRTRVFQAAGIEVANMIDLSRIEEEVREHVKGAESLSVQVPRAEVPQKNRELVKPFLNQVDDWVPLAFFGL